MLTKYGELLKNRRYLQYLLAQILSMLCDIIFKMSLLWAIASEQKGLSSASVVLLLTFLPQVTVGLIGGFAIDRFNRKLVMAISDLTSGFAVLLLFFLMRGKAIDFLPLLIIRFVLSTMDVFYYPAAMAFLPELVGAEQVMLANTLYNIIRQTVNILGAAVTGITLMLVSMENVFLINAILYFSAAALIFFISVKGSAGEKKKVEKAKPHDFVQGFLTIAGDGYLRQFTVLTFALNIVLFIAYQLPPFFAEQVLQGNAATYSAIQTVSSAGVIAGLVVFSALNAKKAGKWYAAGNAIAGIALTILGLVTRKGAAYMLFFAFAFSDALSIPAFTYFQMYVDDAVKGRVFSAFDTLVLLAMPVSSLIMGLIGEGAISNTYVGCGIAVILISLLALCMGRFRGIALHENHSTRKSLRQ